MEIEWRQAQELRGEKGKSSMYKDLSIKQKKRSIIGTKLDDKIFRQSC